jgi:ABC-type multidrug transport system ATPase subunit
MVDRIIVINEGQISETGSYSELVSAGGALASILQSYLQEASDDEDSDPESICFFYVISFSR